MAEEEMVRLTAPAGTDEANVGTTRFKVHDDGTILVPRDAALALECGAAGFVETNPPHREEPSGQIQVRGRAGSSASWGGVTYSVDERGLVTIPVAAFADLAAHGFRAAPA